MIDKSKVTHDLVYRDLHGNSGKESCKQEQTTDQSVAWELESVQYISKFWKFNQLSGRVITLVLWYSASVLNAVMTQDTMGKSATKEKNTRLKYLMMIQMTAPAL